MSAYEDHVNDISKPIAIWDRPSADLYHAASMEDRVAWNMYAQNEATRINNSGKLDSYDTVNSYHKWRPELMFAEWLKLRNETNEAST